MTLSERLKSFQIDTYEIMSEQTGLSEYKIGRIMNCKPTRDEIQSLIKICDHWDVHISEVLQPTMSIQAFTRVWAKKGTVKGL